MKKSWKQVLESEDPEFRTDNRLWVLWEKRIKKEAEKQELMVGRFDVKYVKPRARVDKDLIAVKSFVDFVISINGMSTFFDAKVCSSSVWNLRKYVFNEEKIHQFAALQKAERTGNQAGYLIQFGVTKKIVWVTPKQIQWCLDNSVYSIHPFSNIPGLRVHPDDQIIDFKYLFFGVGAEKYESETKEAGSEGEGFQADSRGQLSLIGEEPPEAIAPGEDETEHPQE